VATIDIKLLGRLPHAEVTKVAFYKRDEITSDLVCCEVTLGDWVWTFHEEMTGWPLLIEHLERLPGFRFDWFAAVSQPNFAASETIAFIHLQEPPHA
jgi:hypothetical protein